MRAKGKTGTPARNRKSATGLLLQKGRVISGNYGNWEVPPEEHGTEIWVIAGPPQMRFFRDRRGRLDRGPVYLRPDGLVARAEYLELLPRFKHVSHPSQRETPAVARNNQPY